MSFNNELQTNEVASLMYGIENKTLSIKPRRSTLGMDMSIINYSLQRINTKKTSDTDYYWNVIFGIKSMEIAEIKEENKDVIICGIQKMNYENNPIVLDFYNLLYTQQSKPYGMNIIDKDAYNKLRQHIIMSIL